MKTILSLTALVVFSCSAWAQSVEMGSSTSSLWSSLRVRTGNGNAIQASVALSGGYAFEASIPLGQGKSAVGYSVHSAAQYGMGFSMDATGAGAHCIAFGANLDGCLLYGANEIGEEKISIIGATGVLRWIGAGSTWFNGANATELVPLTPLGINRIYVRPATGTLALLEDLRSIDAEIITNASGPLKIKGLPTSPTGLASGTLWNDGGLVRVSP